MAKLMPNIRQSSLAFYTFLGLAYIIFTAPPYRAAAVYCYLVLVVGPFILNALTPYLGAACIVLDPGKSYLGTALKI